jgi:hypothetical protein
MSPARPEVILFVVLGRGDRGFGVLMSGVRGLRRLRGLRGLN